MIIEEVIDFENHIQPKFTEKVYDRSISILKDKQNKNKGISLTELRKSMEKATIDLSTTYIKEKYELIDTDEGKIEIGIFSCESTESDDKKPVCLFIHGGGFVGGNFNQYKNQCKLITEKTNAIVVALNYHLSPESFYPVALNDCISVYDWLIDNVESLSGNMKDFYILADSAGVSLGLGMCKSKKIQVKKFFNFYGCIDLSPESNSLYKWSIDKYPIIENHYELLVRKLNKFSNNMNFFKSCYLQNNEDMQDPLISYVFEKDLENTPEMVYFEAEFDYFKLSNRYLCNKLMQYQDVTVFSYKGLDHGFFEHLGYYPEAEDAINKVSRIINETKN